MQDFWSLHHLDSKAAYRRVLQALDTIIGLFVQTYQSQMGMISRIDPSPTPNIFRKPLIILAGVFWEAVTEKCHVDSLQFTVKNVGPSDKSIVIRLTHGAASDTVHAHEFLIAQNKSK